MGAGRDGTRHVKFPEKFLKNLDQRMQDIAMGKDSVYDEGNIPPDARYIDRLHTDITTI